MRISPLPRPWSAPVQASFDRIMPPGAEPLALFRILARSARAWGRFRAGALLDEGPLALRAREIVILRTCALAGCEYEWGVHVALFATKAGLSPGEVTATLEAGVGAVWPQGEAILIEASDALHSRAALPDDVFARLSACYDPDQILEILMLAGYYRTVAYLAGGLALEKEPFAAMFATYRPD